MAKLYFRYGAMNCGKTTNLLQVAHNYEEQGMKVLIMKPSIDTKGGKKMVSRVGMEREVDLLLANNDRVLDYLDVECLPNAIIVDEAQFLTKEQVDELWTVAKIYEVPVLAYGLRTDFLTNAFPGSARLLALADTIEEIKNICKCGKKATQNMRLYNGVPIFEGESVLIDENSDLDNKKQIDYNYEPVCGTCYIKIRKKY